MQINCSNTLACQECGLLHHYHPIAIGREARCRRCGSLLYRHRKNMIEVVLALSSAGLLLFILTNAFPLLALRTQGIDQEMHLLTASYAFVQQDYPLLAIMILLNTIVFPLFEISSLLIISVTLHLKLAPKWAIILFRWLRELKQWAMLEVFMLGILVAAVKLEELAAVIIGPAFWSFCGLILIMAAANATLDEFSVWRLLGKAKTEHYQ